MGSRLGRGPGPGRGLDGAGSRCGKCPGGAGSRLLSGPASQLLFLPSRAPWRNVTLAPRTPGVGSTLQRAPLRSASLGEGWQRKRAPCRPQSLQLPPEYSAGHREARATTSEPLRCDAASPPRSVEGRSSRPALRCRCAWPCPDVTAQHREGSLVPPLPRASSARVPAQPSAAQGARRPLRAEGLPEP